MPTQAKSEKINELTEKLGHATIAILVQTQGLKVKDMTDLRNKMRTAKLEFQVAKNTLLRIALIRLKTLLRYPVVRIMPRRRSSGFFKAQWPPRIVCLPRHCAIYVMSFKRAPNN